RDWSSDVCSSDLNRAVTAPRRRRSPFLERRREFFPPPWPHYGGRCQSQGGRCRVEDLQPTPAPIRDRPCDNRSGVFAAARQVSNPRKFLGFPTSPCLSKC